MVQTCNIGGKTYGIGDVVLDFTGKKAPVVRVHEADGWRWFIARVNPNCDERAIQSLGGLGLRVLQPKEPYEATRSRQAVILQRSVFPRYLFVGLPFFLRRGREEIDFTTPSRCDGVESLLRNAGKPVELRIRFKGTSEIITGDQIAAAFVFDSSGIKDDAPPSMQTPEPQVSAEPHPIFSRGQTARVRKGPMAGLVATIMHAEPNKRIGVLLHMVGRDVPLRLRSRELEVLS